MGNGLNYVFIAKKNVYNQHIMYEIILIGDRGGRHHRGLESRTIMSPSSLYLLSWCLRESAGVFAWVWEANAKAPASNIFRFTITQRLCT